MFPSLIELSALALTKLDIIELKEVLLWNKIPLDLFPLVCLSLVKKKVYI